MNQASTSRSPNAGRGLSEAEIAQRLNLLGIDDLWERTLLSVLLQMPTMVGEMQEVVFRAVRLLGESVHNAEALSRMKETTSALISRRLVGSLKNPAGTLYFLHGDPWNKSIREVGIMILESYSILQKNGNMPIPGTDFVPQLRARLKDKHQMETTDDGVKTIIEALSSDSSQDRLRMIRSSEGDKVSWNGTLQSLSDKIRSLSGEVTADGVISEAFTEELPIVDQGVPVKDGTAHEIKSEPNLDVFATVFLDQEEQLSLPSDEASSRGVSSKEERIPSGHIIDLLGQDYPEQEGSHDSSPHPSGSQQFLFETIARLMADSLLRWLPIETGACYRLATETSGAKPREASVYVCIEEDQDGKYFEIFSLIGAVQGEGHGMKLLRENFARGFSCCIVNILRRDFYALKYAMPEDSNPVDITGMIKRITTETNRVRDIIF